MSLSRQNSQLSTLSVATARQSDFGHSAVEDPTASRTTFDTAYTDARSEVPSSYQMPPEESRDATLHPEPSRTAEQEQQSHSWTMPAAQVASLSMPAASLGQTPQHNPQVGPTEDLVRDPIRPSNSSEGSSLTKRESNGKEGKRSSTSSQGKPDGNDDKIDFDPFAHFNPAERKILEDQSNVSEPRKVTLIELFRFQTRWELFLNAIGILCAVVSGAAQPFMTVVFGSVTTSFTQYFSYVINGATPEVLAQAKRDVLAKTNQNTLYLVYIGIATIVVTYIYEYSFTTSAETTARRIRERYYASVLRQNIACELVPLASKLPLILL